MFCVCVPLFVRVLCVFGGGGSHSLLSFFSLSDVIFFIILYFAGWMAFVVCCYRCRLVLLFSIRMSTPPELLCGWFVSLFVRSLARSFAYLPASLFFIIIIIFIKKSGNSNNNGRSSHEYSKHIREYIVRIACFYRQFISYNACLE